MNNTEKEYNKKIFQSYMKWVTTIAYSLNECSPEVAAEIKRTWKVLQEQSL